MAAPPARARADYDYLIKLLLIGDSGWFFLHFFCCFFFCPFLWEVESFPLIVFSFVSLKLKKGGREHVKREKKKKSPGKENSLKVEIFLSFSTFIFWSWLWVFYCIWFGWWTKMCMWSKIKLGWLFVGFNVMAVVCSQYLSFVAELKVMYDELHTSLVSSCLPIVCL